MPSPPSLVLSSPPPRISLSINPRPKPSIILSLRFVIEGSLFLAGGLRVLLLSLLRLQSREVDIPGHKTLADEEKDDDDKDGKKVRLVVEDVDGLLGGTDGAEPVELGHCV